MNWRDRKKRKNGIKSLWSVSYTHLDVYKRQDLKRVKKRGFDISLLTDIMLYIGKQLLHHLIDIGIGLAEARIRCVEETAQSHQPMK